MRKIFITGIIFWMLFTVSVAQDINSAIEKPVFQRITNSDGLSQGSISAIAQDKLGFIWIGTGDGLNRYDGYNIKVYRHRLDNDGTISSNLINDLATDQTGRIWIATGNGLNLYRPGSDQFEVIDLPFIGKDRIINVLKFDSSGRLWIGTQSSGLICLDIASGDTKLYVNNADDPETVSSNTIRSILPDSRGNIWIGTEDRGIDMLHRQSKTVKRFRPEPGNPYSMSDFLALALLEDPKGNIWIGTYGNSMIYLDTENMRFTNYHKLNPFSRTRLHSIICLHLQEDNLWIGSDSEGLFCFDIEHDEISHFNEGNTENTILYSTISSLFVDNSNNLWIGTLGKGINILSPFTKEFYPITQEDRNGLKLDFSSLRGIYEDKDSLTWICGYGGLQCVDLMKSSSTLLFRGAIYAICPDPLDDDIFWLGTEGTGLVRFNKKLAEGKFKPYQMFTGKDAIDPRKLTGMRVYKIVDGPDDKLYIGTESGLNIYDPNSKLFDFINHVPGNPGSLCEGRIISVYFDKQNTLWAGSVSGGLSRYNEETGDFITYKATGNAGALPDNRINDIFEDSQGNFWIATSMGLCLMSRTLGIFKTFGEPDGLANDVVYGILEDGNGNLWLSTNQGLSKFNIRSETFQNFDSQDGLPGNEFNSNSFFKATDSRLYFGGVNGLVVFNPERIKLNPNPPQPVFTYLTMYARNTVVTHDIAYAEQIRIAPDINLITLEFAALSFINPENCRYAYRFDGNVNNWIDIGHNRSITMNYPEPGTHTLFVKAANSDGIWNERATSVTLTVMPEFHETAWFKFLLGLLVLCSVFAIYIVRINVIKKQKKKLSLLVDQKTEQLRIINKQLKSVNNTKDKFFSIIAHDLKNPFNSLMGFSELLEQEWNEINDREKLEIVKMMNSTSTDTYQLLVNLLEWSRLQSDKIDFCPLNINLEFLIRGTYQQIKANAFLKNLLIRIKVPGDIEVYADENMLNTLVRNLLSNAVKFTPRHGRIYISASQAQGMARCCIEDTGIGMTPEHAAKLFTDDIPETTGGTEGETGTGLGLILCREFVRMHKGKIWVETEPGKGSRFYFTIPLAKPQPSAKPELSNTVFKENPEDLNPLPDLSR
ncbi:MAG: two-component regulator propeller domain-containing protein [Bacteroidales bacterium]